MNDPGIADASSYVYFKRVVHIELKIMSSFMHPNVISNLFDFIYYLWNTKDYILKNAHNQTILVHNDFHCVNKNNTETFCKIKASNRFGTA